MRDRSEFYDDASYLAHLEREIEAAQIRDDQEAEKEARAALRDAASAIGAPAKAAVKRPRQAREKRA